MIIGSGALTGRKDNALTLGAAGKSPCALSASGRDLQPRRPTARCHTLLSTLADNRNEYPKMLSHDTRP